MESLKHTFPCSFGEAWTLSHQDREETPHETLYEHLVAATIFHMISVSLSVPSLSSSDAQLQLSFFPHLPSFLPSFFPQFLSLRPFPMASRAAHVPIYNNHFPLPIAKSRQVRTYCVAVGFAASNGGPMATRDGAVAFEDFFPVMVARLGARGFMEELSKGFRLLMDKEKGVITLESLRRNACMLGLRGMSDEDVRSMLREGHLDGDGSLTEREFCVLMFRLSPGLMKGSKEMLEEEAIDS